MSNDNINWLTTCLEDRRVVGPFLFTVHSVKKIRHMKALVKKITSG